MDIRFWAIWGFTRGTRVLTHTIPIRHFGPPSATLWLACGAWVARLSHVDLPGVLAGKQLRSPELKRSRGRKRLDHLEICGKYHRSTLLLATFRSFFGVMGYFEFTINSINNWYSHGFHGFLCFSSSFRAKAHETGSKHSRPLLNYYILLRCGKMMIPRNCSSRNMWLNCQTTWPQGSGRIFVFMFRAFMATLGWSFSVATTLGGRYMCVQLGLRRPWVSAVLLQGPGSDGPMGPSSAGHS